MKRQEGIARRISQLCAERHITINRLATMSGVPSSTIKNIFQKKSNNTGIVIIKKLCDGLDISLADFFDTEELRDLEQEIE